MTAHIFHRLSIEQAPQRWLAHLNSLPAIIIITRDSVPKIHLRIPWTVHSAGLAFVIFSDPIMIVAANDWRCHKTKKNNIFFLFAFFCPLISCSVSFAFGCYCARLLRKCGQFVPHFWHFCNDCGKSRSATQHCCCRTFEIGFLFHLIIISSHLVLFIFIYFCLIRTKRSLHFYWSNKFCIDNFTKAFCSP